MSVTAAKGWRASGVKAGTKKSGDLDLALILSDTQASVAGAFTTNKAPSAHVQLCRPIAASGPARGVLISAGIAVAAAGQRGIEDLKRLIQKTAREAKVDPDQLLIATTGTIGNQLPVDLVSNAIPAAVAELSSSDNDAAKAIMTTDSRPKIATRKIGDVTIGGIAKGAGMIAPKMAVAHATMLAFITTDAICDAATLREILAGGLQSSFNGITVDGAMSTNDTVLLFANGASGESPEPAQLAGAVHDVMSDLAYQIVLDGEGCTKVIRIRVSGAQDDQQADIAARAVANSILFKSSVWGNMANWGRVIQAIGASQIDLDPNRITVEIGGARLAVDGIASAVTPPPLDPPEVLVDVDLGLKDGSAEVLTCDLSPDFVKRNAD